MNINDQIEYSNTPEEQEFRRAERLARRLERQHRRRQQRIRSLLTILSAALALALCVGLGSMALRSYKTGQEAKRLAAEAAAAAKAEQEANAAMMLQDDPQEAEEPEPIFSAAATNRTVTIGAELSSEYAIVIDLSAGEIVAQKGMDTIISPASMTKILTLLVAAEHLEPEDLDDTVVIDLEITDYCFVNECSVTGFLRDEVVPVRELLYGTILPSGADAALGLARYVAGSHEAFVDMMNEKLDELGLSDTAHFTNCVGLYNKDHLCTVYDIAMILKAAMDNELCREVLTTKIYEIPANDLHPDGMVLSNWFLRRIEDYVPDGLEVLGAKTGYVPQAGSCAASIAQSDAGDIFICVTGKTTSSKQCVQDHVQLYTTYMGY